MVAAPLALARLERGVVADRDEDVLERGAARVVSVDVAGDDRPDARMLGQVAEVSVPARVTALERPLQLDVEALRPEGARERCGGVRVAHAEPVAGTAGEADEALVQLGEQRGIERRRQQLAFLWPGLGVRGGQQAAEVRVALRRLDEDGDVRTAVEGDLGPGDRADADELRRVRELERAVDAVVVGERERLVAELRRPQRQLLRMGGAVQK